MGYVEKQEMKQDEEGRPYTEIGEYLIRKDSGNFTGIYNLGLNLITSKPTWSQAVKLAKLLDEAYKAGYERARDIYYEDAWRD